MEKGRFFVYVLECADGSFYTGCTSDLERRVAEHNEGKGCRYTRARKPVRLVHSEEHDSRMAAMRREREVKKLSRRQKEEMISGLSSR